MAKSSAAKTKPEANNWDVLVWYRSAKPSAECPMCGHPASAHRSDNPSGDAGAHDVIACPALPPPKQATIDEAVVSKGGKPSTDFERSLAAGLANDETAERKKLALVHFDKHPGEPVTLDIAIDQLRPMKGNPRGEDLGDVSGLVKSIEMHGFLGSLMVRELTSGDDGGETYEVWAGNRRLKAAREAGLLVLPCDVYEMSEVQALELNMAEQINRADLTPLQEGDACRRLMELSGYTERQVGEKFGKSASWVTKRVALVGIAPELRKAVTKGELPVTLANALAALPTHQQQVKAYDALQGRSEWEKRSATAEGDAQWLRNTQCRPLADATFKLTDADLVPEAGACSTCKHNSANNGMPGLFDNAKAKPTCALTTCFEDKLLASWLARTAKQKAAGAKVLSLGEGRKLFGNGNALPTSSRYVEAGEKPPKDKAGRTWAELVDDVPAEHRPVLHLAQDNAGKTRSLYVHDKVMEAAATHLKLRWAKNVVEEAEERADPKKKAERDVAEKEKFLAERVRTEVTTAVLDGVMVKISTKFGLPEARMMASDLGDRALTRYAEVTGKKLPKDWLEKGATFDQLLALLWREEANRTFYGYGEFSSEFLALAKTHGFDLDAMAKAQLVTTRAEAEKAAKP